jgi:tRNA A-37 threonylcarbamoyl transferase component Bud32
MVFSEHPGGGLISTVIEKMMYNARPDPADGYECIVGDRRVLVIHRDWLEHQKIFEQSSDALRALPGAQTISDSPHAIVIRVALQHQCTTVHVYYKQYRPQGVRGRLRSYNPLTPGYRVWRASRMLRQRGFRTPTVIAYGHRLAALRRVEAFSVTAAIEPALVGPTYLRQKYAGPLSTDQLMAKWVVLQEFGSLIRRMHDSGIAGGDLRWGNIIVQPGKNGPEPVFLEPDRFPCAGVAPFKERLKNMVQLNMVHETTLSSTDRLRVLRGYEANALARANLARRVRARTMQRMIKKIRKTTGVIVRDWGFRPMLRCWSRQFRAVRYEGWRGYALSGFDNDMTLRHVVSLGDTIRSGRSVQMSDNHGRTTATMRLDTDGHGLQVYVKQDDLVQMGVRKLLRDNLRPSHGWRSWQRTIQLQAAGIPVQQPVAIMQYRRWGVLRKSIYLEEYLSSANSFVRTWESIGGSQAERDGLLETLSTELRALHDRGFYHRDLKTDNILVLRHAFGWSITFIDLEGVVAQRRLMEKDRAIDLGRLWSALLPQTTPAEREHLLERYASIRPSLDPVVLRRHVCRRIDLTETRRYGGLPEVAERLRFDATERSVSTGSRSWLIIALGGSDEVMHMLPLLAALRRGFPSLRLDALVDIGSATVLSQSSSGLHAIMSVSRRNHDRPSDRQGSLSSLQAARLVRSLRYDVTIDLTNSLLSAVLTRTAGSGIRIGYRSASTPAKWLKRATCYTHMILARFGRRDPDHHYLLVAKALGVDTVDNRSSRLPRHPNQDGTPRSAQGSYS